MGKDIHDRTWRIVGFVLGIVFILVLVGVSLGDGVPDGAPASPFWRFVFRWQTLITGILALAGAALAWLGVRKQIEVVRETTTAQIAASHELLERELAERDRRDAAEARQHGIALLKLASIVLFRAAKAILEETHDPDRMKSLDDGLYDFVRIDPRLGLALTGLLERQRDWSGQVAGRGTLPRPAREDRNRLAFDLLVFVAACKSGADLLQRKERLPDILVDEAAIAFVRTIMKGAPIPDEWFGEATRSLNRHRDHGTGTA